MEGKFKKIMAVVGAGAMSAIGVLGYNATYTPADMPNIVTDVIGAGAIDFKVYIPLFILMFVITFTYGRIVLLRDAYGR